MDLKRKIQKIKKQSVRILTGSVLLWAFLNGPVWGEETVAAARAGDPQAEFETMKAEWEKVRDRQILMIQEKEAQLEALKEDLFRQMRPAGSSTPVAAAVGKTTSGFPEEMAASSSGAAASQKKVAELKEANRQLAEQVSQLSAQNSRLKQLKGVELEPQAITDLQREKAELEAQKVAFSRERQKFFQEIIRQKEKLQEQQALLETSKAGSRGPADTSSPAA